MRRECYNISQQKKPVEMLIVYVKHVHHGTVVEFPEVVC